MAVKLAEFTDMDNETILLFQQGDRKAFEKLYDQFAPLLFCAISRIVEDNKDAEAALSRAFIQIWKNRKSYCQQKECLIIWLLRFAREVAFSIKRVKEQYVLPDYDWKQDNSDCAEKLLDMILIFGKTPEEICLLLGIERDVLTSRLHQLFKTGIQKG